MATELTAERLAELRRLVAKATPGPWRLDPEGRGTRVTGSPRDAYGGALVTLCRHIAPGRASHSDARLIVAMRNALPELLRAAEERDALREQCDYYKRDLDAIRAAISPTELGTAEAVANLRELNLSYFGRLVRLEEVEEELDAKCDRLRAQRDALVAAASSAVNGVVIVRDDCDRDVLVADPDKIEALRAAIRAAKENQ